MYILYIFVQNLISDTHEINGSNLLSSSFQGLDLYAQM